MWTKGQELDVGQLMERPLVVQEAGRALLSLAGLELCKSGKTGKH